MKPEFGICMEGFENGFAELVQTLWPTDGKYLEIGLAHGKTFNAVCNLIRNRAGDKWSAVGIDPNPLFTATHEHQLIVPYKSGECLAEIRVMAPYALVLIDGCHCYECAGDDFRRVAPHVQKGGFVLFHDYAPNQQGGGAQVYHDYRPIEVRKAVDSLKASPEFASNWREYPEWVGDRKRGNVANMAVFQRVG